MQNRYFFNIKMFLSLSLLINGLMQAEIPFTWINSLYGVTGNNHQLSLINGLVWYRQNIVKNMYDIWVKQPATMKNDTIKLVEEIFYLQRDGVSFLPTKRADKLATYFTLSLVGSITAVIQEYRKKDKYNKDTFVADIQGTISKALLEKLQGQKNALNEKIAIFKEHTILLKTIEELKNFSDKKINVHQVSKEVKSYFKQQFAAEFDKITNNLIPDKLVILKDKQERREKEYPELKNLSGKPKIKIIDKMTYESRALEKVIQVEAYTNLAELLVGSVEESTKGNSNEHYIPYTTEQILLAFVWAKSNTREDCKEFFDALGQDYVDQNALNNWINTKPEYTRKDYNDFQDNLNKIDQKEIAQFVMANYETAVFAVRAYYMWDQTLPFVFAGTTVEYIKDGKVYSFADCGETSLRNFFNIILKNLGEGKFDINYLLNAKSVSDTILLKISEILIKFYKKNFSFDNVTSLQLYNDWTYVVEDLNGVQYVEPSNEGKRFYEIDSGINNILQVLNNLLFGDNEKFKELSKKEKLDLICKQLSRDNFTLGWQAFDDKDNPADVNTHDFLTLKFEVNSNNKKVFFEWKFEANHFVLSTQSTSYPIADNKVGQIALQMKTQPLDQISIYTLLGCYANKDNFELLCAAAGKGLSSDQLTQLIYCFYDVKADWGIIAEKLRDLNRTRMILGIAKNASEDTALVNFFLSEWLRDLPRRSSLEVQKDMAKELLTFNQVHTASLPFILDRFSINMIDISKLPGIGSFIQKLDMQNVKQKNILIQLVALMIKDNINLFPIALAKINELNTQDSIKLLMEIFKINPTMAQNLIQKLIPISSNLDLIDFFIKYGEKNNIPVLVNLATARSLKLLEKNPIVQELSAYEYEID